ncbi:copper resistance protein CopC [Edaphobacter sp.]|uniref:copper resistance protein CopC n=1 Tax=Edaphobacter sp. TaxID=1934404 RepID=UPI002DBEDCF1|nr:copper resistance protein CopC [Edaphobacter sp.]HEU5339876.1 copper resistance protein CopC [Edaphobacter sp.]
MKLRPVLLTVAAFGVFLFPAPVRAQGCVQCRDNTAATSPATQRAYRHAIEMMVAVAGGIFITTLVLLKRHSPDK